MTNPTQNRTLHASKEPGPFFDRFKLRLEKSELSQQREHEKMVPKLMDGTSLDTRPDFGMTVPPVAERRREQRKASEGKLVRASSCVAVVRALFVVKES